MTEPKTPAAKAAGDEKTDQPKKIKWRKLELELPSKLPGTVYFDIFDLDAVRTEEAQKLSILRNVIGDDQFADVRNRIIEDEIPAEDVDDAIDELLEKVMGTYGLTQGNS